MRVIFNRHTKEVVAVVDENQTSITWFPNEYGVIQGDINIIEGLAVELGLDLQQIPQLNISLEKQRLIYRLKRCRDVKIRFLEENATIYIPNSIQMLQSFMTISLLLDMGDAKSALQILESVSPSIFLVTIGYTSPEQRYETYINELQGIVNDLFD